MIIRRWAVTGVLTLSACTTITTGPEVKPSRSGPFAALSSSQIYVEKGIKYMDAGSYDVALSDFKRAAELDANNTEAYNALGVLYQRLGDLEKSETSFKKALSVQTDNFGARNNYGRLLCERGKYADAFEQFDKVINTKLYNQPWIPLTNAGVCAHGAGKRAEAENYLRKALEAEPGFPPALLEMAKLSHETGQQMSARAFLQRYLDAAQPTPEALMLGIEIESRLGNDEGVQDYAKTLRAQFPDSKEAVLARRRLAQ